jgi:cell wall-associated NlpC family hydrolase
LLALATFVAATSAGAQSATPARSHSAKAVASKAPLRALEERGPNPKGPFAKLSSEQRDSIGEAARQLLGTRYKWAGVTPAKGLDCSGFVKYVFAKLGIELPHSAKELATMGGSISKDTAEMRPGDLLFFGKGKRISHVSIYLGDGMMIHASSSNKSVVETPVVKYRPAGGLQWKGVRRVIDTTATSGGDSGPGPGTQGANQQ